MKFNMETSVTRAEALELLRANWKPGRLWEYVPVENAAGRYLAEDVTAKYNAPPCRGSAMDGIAVESRRFGEGMPDVSSWREGEDYVRADTGDDFPDRFDAVIAVEDITLNEGHLSAISEQVLPLREGSCIRPAGTLCRRGELIAPKGTRITPLIASTLVIGGARQVPVFRKPRIVYVPTGDELIGRGEVPSRGQTFESNSVLVRSMAEEMGAEVCCFPIIRDDREALSEAIDEALRSGDIVIVNGGSSRGSEDFNCELLREKASFFRHGVRAAPGRPVGLAVIDHKPVINMPGPPIASFIAMDWCIRGLVAHYYGVRPAVRPTVRARLAEDLWRKKGHEMYYLFGLTRNGEEYTAHYLSPGRYTLPATALSLTAMLILPAEAPDCRAGDLVTLELMRSPELLP